MLPFRPYALTSLGVPPQFNFEDSLPVCARSNGKNKHWQLLFFTLKRGSELYGKTMLAKGLGLDLLNFRPENIGQIPNLLLLHLLLPCLQVSPKVAWECFKKKVPTGHRLEKAMI